MGTYVSMGAYDAVLSIPSFKGLLQYGDGVGLDPRYAAECSNALTTQGYLRPMCACDELEAVLPRAIDTLTMLHRRWYRTDGEKDIIIASCNGQLYWTLPSGDKWRRIPLPATFAQERYQGENWSCVSYEINPDGAESPVDVLLMSNAKDGMICVRGDDLSVTVVPTPKKFGVIARHAERIWGGAIEGDPDMLVYSAPYDPFDWEQNDEIPQDGAGDVQQPSWDGDSFTGLIPFGNQLIATKRTKIWRVMGLNPDEYVFSQQYGSGTAYPHTVAVDGTKILMLGNDGLLQFDGETVAPFEQESAKGIFSQMNRERLDGARACLYKGTYYCALPLGDTRDNNAVLMYNTKEGTFLLRMDTPVESFLPTETDLFFTSSTAPGHLYIWQEDSWETKKEALPMQWVTPWFDFGYKNVQKGSFAVFFTAECAEEAELTIGIQTEKKLKKKTVVILPPDIGKQAKQKRLVFGGNGRRFRVLIESNGKVPWRFLGGMQLEIEIDKD